MIKEEVVKLNVILKGLRNVGNTKFVYFVIKNMRLLKPHIEPLMEIENSNKALLIDFEKARNEIIIEIGKNGENGSIFIDVNDSIMVSLFNEKLQELIKEHKSTLDKFDVKMKDFKDFLQEDLEEKILFRTISIDDCPDKGITAEQLETLIDFNIIK